MVAEAPRSGKPWTDEELRLVSFHWGAEPIDQTAARVGRTVGATRDRLRRCGVGGAGRGRLTVQQVAQATGYTWRQVARGIRLAGVRPLVLRASGRRRRRLLTESQVERVVAALGRDTADAASRPTTAGLAEELGVTRRTVERWVVRLGLERDRGALRSGEDADRLRWAILGEHMEHMEHEAPMDTRPA